MNAANRTFAGIAVVLILIALCPVATAQVDCNGVNGLDTDDVVYLISYFFNDGLHRRIWLPVTVMDTRESTSQRFPI